MQYSEIQIIPPFLLNSFPTINKQPSIMKKIIIISLLALAIAFSACNHEQPTKVACVGDSITEGSGLAPQSTKSYPYVLDSLSGNQYAVINLGRSATTLLQNGDFPYWTAKEFSNVFVYKPEVIIIKLGSNDTKPQNWDAQKYKEDYQALIDTFGTISTNPQIYLCKPVPVFKTRWGINDSTIVNGVIPAVEEIAKANGLPLIDLYNPMQDKGNLFPDHIHPNAEGAAEMARLVYEGIK